MPTKLAIVSAYNEDATVAEVVRDLQRHGPDLDVLVVDDGSTDGTSVVGEQAGATVLRMPFNLGIGGTAQAGSQYALERGYSYAVQVDGDGQHDARELQKLLTHLGAKPDVDMMTGSRFLSAATRGASRAPGRAAPASASSPASSRS